MERVFLCILLLLAALVGLAQTLVSDELAAERYDCALELRAASVGSVTLALEGTVRLTVTPGQIALVVVEKGKEARVFDGPLAVPADAASTLTVLRRDGWLGIAHGGAFLYRGMVKRGPGATATLVAAPGWKAAARVQVLEPVAFADNFMRSAEEPGAWAVQRGAWALQSAWDADPKGNAHRFANAASGQNPFAWRGTGSAGVQSALCTAGRLYWEDYRFTVAVRPEQSGAVGAMVNMPDARGGLLVRWSPANNRGPDGDRLTLTRVTDGKRELLATSSGGYVPGQWYRLQVESSFDGTVRVLVDDQERLALKDIVPWRGGVGLYAEGAGGVFDDVTVYGRGLKGDLLAESQLSHLTRRFLDDANGMGKWTNAGTDWQPDPAQPLRRVHRLDFYGDHWLTATVRPSTGGALWLALQADGPGALKAGFSATVTVEKGTLSPSYALYRNGAVIARGKGKALAAADDYTFRLRRAGAALVLEQDGAVVAKAEKLAPVTGTRPAWGCDGMAVTQPVLVLGQTYYDDVFTEAPVAWVGHGAWAQTVRWACSPEWSFLGGYSPGEAALWYKGRIDGDQTFQAWLGIIMEYPRERDSYHARYRDLAITICGDGLDPHAGYAGIYGAPGADGRPNARTVLLRNGAVVASCPLTIPPFDPQTHRNWYDLRLVKHGATVEFYVEGRLALSYTDSVPLAGGMPAAWTRDSGITLARARLSSVQPTRPRREAAVIIATPTYPEWVDIGTPLVLDFARSWSTAGHDVTLQALAIQTPKTDEPSLKIDGKRVTFAPTEPGCYWYRLQANDGQHRSPDHHLLTTVFNPAVGRDDSRALVLYRFTEGKGDTVIDYGAKPPLNLKVPEGAAWLSGQGLSVMHASDPMMSANDATKLRPLAQSKAFTVELWVSNPTIHPVNNRANILSWEGGSGTWNFAVGHCESSLMLVPGGVGYLGVSNSWANLSSRFRTGLTHIVVTWDGRNGTGYLNGVRQESRYIYLNPGRWNTNAPLLLGRHSDGTDHYLGTYYLAAIHDGSFTAEQVQRHYQAGPGAQ